MHHRYGQRLFGRDMPRCRVLLRDGPPLSRRKLSYLLSRGDGLQEHHDGRVRGAIATC